MAVAYFKQVYPLHPGVADLLGRRDRLILIEGNATGQFEKLLRLKTCIEVDDLILKYNGLQYSVEEIQNLLIEILGGGK